MMQGMNLFDAQRSFADANYNDFKCLGSAPTTLLQAIQWSNVVNMPPFAHSQRQRVGDCNLVMSCDTWPIWNLITRQAQAAGPKLVIGIGAGKSQFTSDGAKTRRRAFGVDGRIQHAQIAIFGQHEGRFFEFGLDKKHYKLCIVNRDIVQQGQQYIHVE